MTSRQEISELIEEKKKRLEELKKNLPAHSVKPSMLMEIEDLEMEIEELEKAQTK